MNNLILISAFSASLLLFIILWWASLCRQRKLAIAMTEHSRLFLQFSTKQDERYFQSEKINHYIQQLIEQQKSESQQQRQQFDAHQLETFRLLQSSLQKSMADIREQITSVLDKNTSTLDQKVSNLTQETQRQLQAISMQVDQRLAKGFEKTTETFTDVVKRLAIIDEAQKKITDLSSDVVSLQSILTDKRSRGAFGEVQLHALIRNMLPSNHYHLQYTLKNGMRCDCLLELPEPTGNIVIDAKFPLENYQKIMQQTAGSHERKACETAFIRDIKKHIRDIADKYIVPGETADGAVMFIPAEAIFADIHAYYPELVQTAQRARVWLVSPTTLMAILTTARAVLKDAATRQQAHVIQQHLHLLSKDFALFKKRMENLSRHIQQAYKDVEEVSISSRKISKHFTRIEKVEIKDDNETPLTSLINQEEA